jgi:Flp pilus assembly protein TadG
MKLAARVRDDSGAVSILAVLFIGFALFVVLALTTEVGHLYVARRQAQSAADAGALAAADSLSVSDAAAIAAGEGYVTKNLPTATKTVTLRYNGDSNKVKVAVGLAVTPFFTIFPAESVGAHAVASRIVISPKSAVYGKLYMDVDPTAKVDVQGGVHSDGYVDITKGTGSFKAGELTYYSTTKTVLSGVASATPVFHNATQMFPGSTNWPVSYGISLDRTRQGFPTDAQTIAELNKFRQLATACGEPIIFDKPTTSFNVSTAAAAGINPSNMRGLIICNDFITPNDTTSRWGGTVTVIALGRVHLDCKSTFTAWDLPGFADDPLFLVGNYWWLGQNAAGSSLTGVIYVPNGRAEMKSNSSTNSDNLLIEADWVLFRQGSDFKLTGIGPVLGSRTRSKLTE